MRQKHYEVNDYNTTVWSGGETTELYIYPEAENYANRKFLFRISSATVKESPSYFTSLDDYSRILMVLEGQLSLTHNKSEPVHLKPQMIDQFDGGDDTVSEGTATDFNVMFRKDINFDVAVEPLNLFPAEKKIWQLMRRQV